MENVEKVCIEGAKVIRRMQVSGVFFLEFFSTCPVCHWMAVVRGGLRFTGRTVAGSVSGPGGCANFIGQVVAEISKLLCVLAYMQKNMKILYLSHYSVL